VNSAELTADGEIVAAIDIGSSKLVLTLADASGWLVRLQEDTVRIGMPSALPQQLLRMLAQACAQKHIPISAVRRAGVASCGPFLKVAGQLELAAPNLCGALATQARGLDNSWRSIPLEAVLRTHFSDLVIENDCVAALIAERRWGALQGFEHCAYVTWSTGIGVGLCVDGQILHGKNGNAGHAGHMFTAAVDAAALCGCGNTGDVEGSCGGFSIEARAGMPAAEVFRAALANDPACAAIVRHAVQSFAHMLYNLFVTLDLQRIALGGSVFQHHAHWVLPAIQAAMPQGLRSVMDHTGICGAGLGAQVGDFAALALVVSKDQQSPNRLKSALPVPP
jgi:glucokinase